MQFLKVLCLTKAAMRVASPLSLIAPLFIFCSAAFGQSDLSRLLQLMDEDKQSSLREIKQLRERNAQNPQQAPLFDFAFGLAALRFDQPKGTFDTLGPFVERRPQVVQARCILIRACIELEKFDYAVSHAEKLLDSLSTPTEGSEKATSTEISERIVRHIGTLVGFLNFAKPDSADELKLRLEKVAEAKIPESLMETYRESIALVESRVGSIEDEIAKASEKSISESEAKVAIDLADAEKLRDVAKVEVDQLKEREKSRAEKIEEIKQDAEDLVSNYSGLVAEHRKLTENNSSFERERRSLERTTTKKDRNGNEETRMEITNRPRYDKLGRDIARNSGRMEQLNIMAQTYRGMYQQLQVRAAGLLNQQEIDQLFTSNRMQAFGMAAENKEKQAEQEAKSKSKKSKEELRLSRKKENFDTYEALDSAYYIEYLKKISQRFIAN